MVGMAVVARGHGGGFSFLRTDARQLIDAAERFKLLGDSYVIFISGPPKSDISPSNNQQSTFDIRQSSHSFYLSAVLYELF